MNSKLEIDKFILLSKVLTDRVNLNKRIATEYLDRLKLQFPAEIQLVFTEMDKIISSADEKYWEFELKRKIIENEKKFIESDPKPDETGKLKEKENNSLSAISQQILRLWYTSQFIVKDDKTDMRTREQYNEGLLWKVIHTEAPGADKKRKYGFWKMNPVKTKKPKY